MKKVLLLLVVATAVMASSCNKTIKVKRLVGEWKVASYESTSTSEETETTSYNRSECEPNNFDAVDTESSETTRINNGGSETITYQNTSNGTFVGTTGSGTINMNINIKDDGTYEVTGTYEYSYRGFDGTDPERKISGTIATSGSNWYLLDGDKKNAAVTFVDFPFFMDASFTGSTLSFGSTDVTFDIDDASKDEIILVYNTSKSTTDTVVDPPSNFPETNCIRTRVYEESSTFNLTITLTQ